MVQQYTPSSFLCCTSLWHHMKYTSYFVRQHWYSVVVVYMLNHIKSVQEICERYGPTQPDPNPSGPVGSGHRAQALTWCGLKVSVISPPLCSFILIVMFFFYFFYCFVLFYCCLVSFACVVVLLQLSCSCWAFCCTSASAVFCSFVLFVKTLLKKIKGPTKSTYHALFNIIVLCHLDEGLEQSVVMLDEYLTGFPVSTLNTHTHTHTEDRQ